MHNRSTMLDNFKKNVVDPLLGCSYEVDGDDSEVLDSQTAQLESGVHDGPHVRPDIKSHWLSAIADTIQVAGCHCFWCTRNSNSAEEVEREQPSQYSRVRPHGVRRSSMAARSEVMEVLYPPSYLNRPQGLDPEATPPAYESRTIVPSNTPKVQSPCISPQEDGELELLVPASSRLMRHTPQGLLTPSTESVPSYNLSDTDTPFLDLALPSAQSPRPRPQLPITGIGLEYPECDRDEPPAYSRFDSSRPRFPTAFDILGPYPHISIPFPNFR
ncbi:hypothetical protein K503DRAFT_374866 [Rhizopogon vinicolor AM-OR11-026]|uniref:Uncharacterized protein n=1 Tax=Rhizopogon vinicolor AM-OR11-026 TaxID=1314800 RepID=A0A1B7NBL0_9AGAM|nr:hypothetical protein K503DRAFT_374866 [Rhizopogon vinicolor AM-OR11-026]